jgi:hypothetical protein
VENEFLNSMSFDDFRLVRFVTFGDATRILSDYSTFCLFSTNYYWQQGWEIGDSIIGDTHENIFEFLENGQVTKHFESLNATLLSCWTMLDQKSIANDDWKMFPGREDGVAIVSTVSALRALLTGLAQGVLDKWIFRDGKVVYHDGWVAEFETMDAWLYKRRRYECQREYRFAFLKGSPSEKVQSVIFYVREPKSYINAIYFGPKMTHKQKGELLVGAIKAEVAGRIQDFDRHFKPPGKKIDGY